MRHLRERLPSVVQGAGSIMPVPDSLSFPLDWTRCKERLYRMFAGESRRQLMVSISSLAGSGMISIGLRFIGSIIQGRFVDPEILGYYTKFTILPGYMFFLHLGIFTSLARQYPYFMGKGERDTALSYAANALGWTRLICALHAVVFFIPCVWAICRGNGYAAIGWGAQIILTTTSLYMLYLGSTFRNSSEFVAWSKAQVVSSIASLCFLPLVAVHQFLGICTRYSLSNLLSMLYAHRKRPLKIRRRFDQDVIMRMIVFGAPLMVFAYINTYLWDAIQRTYILKMTDEKTLGIFAFAVTLCVGLTTVATAISQVFNPRIAMRYGSSGKDMAVSFQYCMKCTMAGSAVMLPLIVLAYWLVDPLVTWLLPKYIACIPITRSLMWLSLIPVIDLPKQLLMVAKRTRQYGFSVVVGFVSFLVLLSGLALWCDSITLQIIVIFSVVCKMLSVFISIALSWRNARLSLNPLQCNDIQK